MTESEKTIDEIVNRIVEEKLSQRNQVEFERAVAEEVAKYVPQTSRKICQGWLDLRVEIQAFATTYRSKVSRGHDTVLQSIYAPIRLTLGMSRLDEMSEEQVLIAREIFKYVSLMIVNHNPKLNKEPKK